MRIKLNIFFIVLLLVSLPHTTPVQSGTFHLDYATYLGGAGNDYGWAIAVDSSGSAYLCGNTSSSDFPTGSAYQPGGNGSVDAFITKFNASGSELLYSTYLGGAGDDYGYSIEVDSDGSAYLCGSTASSDFPTTNPYHATFSGGMELFVTKLSTLGDALGGGSAYVT